MGEWQAWHPTVSRQSRSTDITDAFGPGTRWSAGPESYIDEVVAASPGLLLAASLVFRVPSGPPARRSGSRCLLDLVNLSWCLRAAAGPGRASRSTTPSRRLACGDLAGGPPPSDTRECALARRHPPHWWRGCVVGGQARTWRIHGLGAELPCTRRRVRKM